MIAFRKAHAALRPLNFYSSPQLAWWTPAGTTPDATYFNNGMNHAIAYQLSGSSLGDSYSSVYVAYNAWSGNVDVYKRQDFYGRSQPHCCRSTLEA